MRWVSGYREFRPPVGSVGVQCLWVNVAADDADTTTLVLPDGCTDLIWVAGRGAHIAGPDTGPLSVRLPAGTFLAGARFRPGAGGPALGLALSQLRDLRPDLADVRPDLARRLPGDLEPFDALRAVGAAAVHAAAAGPPDRLVAHAIRGLVPPGARVEGVASELGVSERQLRRRFECAVGYGPKLLQQVLRFRRFQALATAGRVVDLAAAAALAGYADQAHLSRECRRLSGLTPAQLAGRSR